MNKIYILILISLILGSQIAQACNPEDIDGDVTSSNKTSIPTLEELSKYAEINIWFKSVNQKKMSQENLERLKGYVCEIEESNYGSDYTEYSRLQETTLYLNAIFALKYHYCCMSDKETAALYANKLFNHPGITLDFLSKGLGKKMYEHIGSLNILNFELDGKFNEFFKFITFLSQIPQKDETMGVGEKEFGSCMFFLTSAGCIQKNPSRCFWFLEKTFRKSGRHSVESLRPREHSIYINFLGASPDTEKKYQKLLEIESLANLSRSDRKDCRRHKLKCYNALRLKIQEKVRGLIDLPPTEEKYQQLVLLSEDKRTERTSRDLCFDSLAVCAFSLKRYKECIEYAEKNIDGQRVLPLSVLHCAAVSHYRLGELDRAGEYFSTILVRDDKCKFIMKNFTASDMFMLAETSHTLVTPENPVAVENLRDNIKLISKKTMGTLNIDLVNICSGCPECNGDKRKQHIIKGKKLLSKSFTRRVRESYIGDRKEECLRIANSAASIDLEKLEIGCKKYQVCEQSLANLKSTIWVISGIKKIMLPVAATSRQAAKLVTDFYDKLTQYCAQAEELKAEILETLKAKVREELQRAPHAEGAHSDFVYEGADTSQTTGDLKREADLRILAELEREASRLQRSNADPSGKGINEEDSESSSEEEGHTYMFQTVPTHSIIEALGATTEADSSYEGINISREALISFIGFLSTCELEERSEEAIKNEDLGYFYSKSRGKGSHRVFKIGVGTKIVTLSKKGNLTIPQLKDLKNRLIQKGLM